jgi:hypothetical protein
MKPLGHGGYLVRPYTVYKQHSYSYIYPSASDSTNRVNIDEALPASPGWEWLGSSEPVNTDGIYKRPLHTSVRHRFYSTSSVSQSMYGNAQGTEYVPSVYDSFYVVNITQDGYGEGIRPESILLTAVGSTDTVRDDGAGHLYINSTAGKLVGNVFYSLGLMVIQKASGSTINANGMFLANGDNVRVRYDSTVTIQEHTAVCTIEASEMNWSSNPTINPNSVSSSISGSNPIIREFVSGNLTPYMTTVGLYNSVNELVAVAKVPRPIKRTPEMSQTFVVRFDL